MIIQSKEKSLFSITLYLATKIYPSQSGLPFYIIFIYLWIIQIPNCYLILLLKTLSEFRFGNPEQMTFFEIIDMHERFEVMNLTLFNVY